MSKSDKFSGRLLSGVWMPVAGISLLAMSSAQAADLSIKFFGSENLEFTDNLNVTETNKDAAVTSTTAASADILVEAKTYLLRFTPSISTRGTFFSDTDTKFDVYPGASFDARKTTKRTTYSTNASIAYSPITSDDLLEGIIFSQEGNELRYSAGTGISHRLSPSDTLTWDTFFNRVSYSIDSPSLQENSEYGTSLNWRSEFSKLTSVTVGANLSYYDPTNGGSNNPRLSFQPTLGLDTRLTKRLQLGGQLGVSFNEEKGSDLNADVLANVNATYTLNETKLTFSLGREVTTAQRGDLVSRYKTAFGVEHQINDRTAFNLSSTYTTEPVSGGPDEVGLLISPGLSYQLTRDWSSSVRYQFAGTGDTDNLRYENAVILNLSYGTTLLP